MGVSLVKINIYIYLCDGEPVASNKTQQNSPGPPLHPCVGALFYFIDFNMIYPALSHD